MSKNIHAFIEGVPATKGSVSVSKQGRVFHTNKSVAWEKEVRKQLSDDIEPFVDCAVVVELDFYLPRPKSVNRQYPYKRGFDLDKGVRAVLDAITGYCYIDDAQVCILLAEKNYVGMDGILKPGVCIAVYEHHERFEE